MEVKIYDGTGKGFGAKVDSNKRLHTDNVGRTQSQQAVLEGRAFNFSTGNITLTSANQSAIFYIKNDNELPLIVKVVGVRIGASTGGTGSAILQLSANATGGTIISNALPLATNFNRDLGSSNDFDGLGYKGAEGYTLTGGTSAGSTATADFSQPVRFEDENFKVPKGTSLGLLFTPPAGNTSQSVVVFCTAFYENADI